MSADKKEHDEHATPHGLSSAESAKLERLVMLACPFCGAPAGVKSEAATFQIIGCMTRTHETMLCPSPTMVVYKKEGGNFDYTYWNRRAT